MKHTILFVSLVVGSCSTALAQTNSGGSAAGQTSTNSSSIQGTAGTNVGGTIHTNQGNQFGNSASGAPSSGMARTGQPATNKSQSESGPSQSPATMGTAGGSPTNRRGGSPGTSSRQ